MRTETLASDAEASMSTFVSSMWEAEFIGDDLRLSGKVSGLGPAQWVMISPTLIPAEGNNAERMGISEGSLRDAANKIALALGQSTNAIVHFDFFHVNAAYQQARVGQFLKGNAA